MYSRLPKQKGFVLILTLMLLVAISLVAIPAIRANIINMKIISNQHSKDLLRSKVNRAIEQMVSDVSGTTYIMPTAKTLNVDGQTVYITRPRCIASTVARGYSVDDEIPPEDTLWEVIATGKSSDGSEVTIVQGLKIRMLTGSCT